MGELRRQEHTAARGTPTQQPSVSFARPICVPAQRAIAMPTESVWFGQLYRCAICAHAPHGFSRCRSSQRQEALVRVVVPSKAESPYVVVKESNTNVCRMVVYRAGL